MIKCIAIDDDKLFLKFLETLFQQMKGFELIQTFDNAVDGIMESIKLKPDILLLDYEMPYLDGVDALDIMERRPKVIMISGHLSQPEAKDFPVDGFIGKPELKTQEILVAEIKRVLV